MQIQIISTYSEMQSAFNEILHEALKTIPKVEASPAPYVISGNELKTHLGVTIQTVIRWRNRGKIPFLKIGSSIRYDLNAVIKALEVGNKTPRK